jgi:hypothetical protein
VPGGVRLTVAEGLIEIVASGVAETENVDAITNVAEEAKIYEARNGFDLFKSDPISRTECKAASDAANANEVVNFDEVPHFNETPNFVEMEGPKTETTIWVSLPNSQDRDQIVVTPSPALPGNGPVAAKWLDPMNGFDAVAEE